jgi:hypothetical protein
MTHTYKTQCSACQTEITFPIDLSLLSCPNCETLLDVYVDGGVHFLDISEPQLIDNQLIMKENPEFNTDVLRLNRELNALNKDWYQRREQFRIQTNQGSFIPVKQDIDRGFLYFSLGFILSLLYVLTKYWGNVFLIFLPIIVFGLSIFSILKMSEKAKNYMIEKNKYEARKRKLREAILQSRHYSLN